MKASTIRLTALTVILGSFSQAAVGSQSESADSIYEKAAVARKAEDYALAVPLFQKSCDVGLLDGCAQVEIARRRGNFLLEDIPRANDRLQELCDHGSAIACSAYASAFYFGIGFEKNVDKSVPFYRKACESDTRSGVACHNLGVILRDGEGSTAADVQQARQFFTLACDLKLAVSCENLGLELAKEDFVASNFARVVQVLQSACDFELGSACNSLGIALDAAANPQRDAEAAIIAFRRACVLENAFGCTNAANALPGSTYDGADAALKLSLNSTACELDRALGCNRAGWFYADSNVIPTDLTRAAEFWARGCAIEDIDNSVVSSCDSLARYTGRGPHAEISILRDEQRRMRREGNWREAVLKSARALSLLEGLLHTKSVAYAQVANQHALNLNEAGQDIQAAEYAKISWRTREELFGQSNRDTLNALHNYATIVSRQGNAKLAEQLLDQVYKLRADLLGVDHPDTFAARQNRAIQLGRLGRHDEAMDIVEQSLAVLKDKRGPDDPVTLSWRYSLAVELLGIGRIEEALATTDELVAMASAGQSIGVDPMSALMLRAEIASALGETKFASELHRRIAEVRVEKLGRDHRDTILQMNTYAVSLSALGRYVEAEEIYRENVSLLRNAYGDDHPRTLLTLSNLGFALGAQGRLDDRLTIHESIMERRRRLLGENNPNTLYSMFALAEALAMTNRLADARDLAADMVGRMRRVVGSDHPDTLRRTRYFASLLVQLGEFGHAEKLYREILAMQLALQDPAGRGDISDTGDVVSTKEGLAKLLLQTGRSAQAEALLADLVPVLDRRLGDAHPDTISMRAELVRSRLNQPSRRLAAWSPALRLASTLEASGFGAVEAGRTQEIDPRNRAKMFPVVADAAWEQFANQGVASNEARAVAFRAIQNAMDGPATQAMAISAARNLAEESGEGLGALARRREEAEKELAQADSALTRALIESGANSEALRDQLEARKTTLISELAGIDETLEREAPDYFALTRPEALSLVEAQALLAADETVLMMVPTEFGTHVMVVNDRGLTWHRVQATETDIGDMVATLRRDLDPGGATRAAEGQSQALSAGLASYDRDTAYRLYQALIAPVAGALAGKTQLYFAAVGALASLPLGVLVTEKPTGDDADPEVLRTTSWLADAYALVQIPSLQSLAMLRQFEIGDAGSSATGTTKFAGFGNPVLDGRAATRGGRGSGGVALASDIYAVGRTRDGGAIADISALRQLASLPGTATELIAIRDTLGAPASAIRLADEATEASVRSADLSDTRILAFATHGLLAGEVEGVTEPGLVLTPPPTASEEDDGLLTASEITTLDLDADWVILSACNTAAGDGAGGKGLSGLARAFFYAGARSLLASHWPVRDDMAAEITTRAIRIENETRGVSRAKALQQAMREARSSPSDPTTAHPAAWAPFTLVGEGR